MAVIPEALKDAVTRLNRDRGFIKRSIRELEEQTPTVEDISRVQSLIDHYSRYLRENYDPENDEVFPSIRPQQHKLNSLLDRVKVQAPPTDATARNATPVNSPHINLPTVSLPTFTGKTREWFAFRDQFNALVSSNTALTNTQRLQYLKSALKGEAAAIIAELQVTDTNYEVAMQLLRDNYENKRLIINSHVKELFDLPRADKNNAITYRELLNKVNVHVRALEALGRPVEHWDILIHVVTAKLPASCRLEWETLLEQEEMPTFGKLRDFLTQKCANLTAVQMSVANVKPVPAPRRVLSVAAAPTCSHCNADHWMEACEAFIALTPRERMLRCQELGICKNCLRGTHRTKYCRRKPCDTCRSKHNRLLHLEPQPPVATVAVSTQDATIPEVMLSTCVVYVRDGRGHKQMVRALLDSGSQANLMTTECANRLRLPRQHFNLSVSGVGHNVTSSKKAVHVDCSSRHSSFKMKMTCCILPHITPPLPAAPLRAEHFFKLLTTQQIAVSESLTLQNTAFGWVLGGKVADESATQTAIACTVTYAQLDARIKRFWEVEQVSKSIACLTADEQYVERHFAQTVKRDADGRFIVRLPWKTDPAGLGSTFELAKKRFLATERRLEKDLQLRSEYQSFMRQYIELQHMKRVELSREELEASYYLPHHAVLKRGSDTTKVRVVFDASTKARSGQSLNDLLFTGPTLQDDLLSLLLRFRTHQYVLNADIKMMYRQIGTDPTDNKYQRVLWRESKYDPLVPYELQTVTYGTACAPYLAVKCLATLAAELPPKYQNILTSDFYMDDLLTGAATLKELTEVRDVLNQKLSSAGFILRKWASNHADVLNGLNSNVEDKFLFASVDSVIKALGLRWRSATDLIGFSTRDIKSSQADTKRGMLSIIAQLYDPLGLIGPVVVLAKVLLQEMWQRELGWDDLIPEPVSSKWQALRCELDLLNQFEQPRKVIGSADARLELHAFGDASEAAYGTAIYIRSVEPNGSTSSRLLCAKSRVAPLKSLSLPRLELCAAVLTAQLAHRVRQDVPYEFHKVRLYTDSTIVLSWIHSPPKTFRAFVSHRIGEIHTLTEPRWWVHISSQQNPADLISRGRLPSELLKNQLWFEGPTIMGQLEPQATFTPDLSPQPSELRILVAVQAKTELDLVTRFSSYTRLIRITAWLFRFCFNVRARPRIGGPVASPLLQLNPFIDATGLLRVGGRLRHSKYRFDFKYPIVLPAKHSVTDLIIRRAHLEFMHAGNQATLAQIRMRYWPLCARRNVRRVLHSCIVCFKARPRGHAPLMGDLPLYRTECLRAFTKVGVDLCGPFQLKEGRQKQHRVVKAYIALFVCMSTKASHIEIVGDLTSEAFLAALRRFAARRGHPSDIYSDNATNFTGCNRELKSLREFWEREQDYLQGETAMSRTVWHFIPPRAPHFGGLWEAAVKRFKHHFYRVVGSVPLRYEEMLTIALQAEAILNSRPLIPLSQDPNDTDFLTPAHFLIGTAMTALPEPNLEPVKINRLSRWQHLQQMQQHLWRRWQREYLQELQGRRKWTKNPANLQVGQLVLLKDDNTPPGLWRSGRIQQVHPGKDGIVRAATVHTNQGDVQRVSLLIIMYHLV